MFQTHTIVYCSDWCCFSAIDLTRRHLIQCTSAVVIWYISFTFYLSKNILVFLLSKAISCNMRKIRLLFISRSSDELQRNFSFTKPLLKKGKKTKSNFGFVYIIFVIIFYLLLLILFNTLSLVSCQIIIF